jgi:protein-disulfide isomerase
MKRALLSIAILLCTTTTQAQRVDPQAPLKNFAARVLPRCPGGTLTLEAIPGGPAGFDTYGATIRSSDKYCGGQKYLLHSPKSQQVLVGSIIQIPAGAQPVATRIATEAGRLLSAAMTATVAPFPLPDGLKAVTISRQTPYGPFGYNGFLDQSGKFLLIGFRSSLSSDPSKLFREQLGADTASRRGTKTSKVEIIEVSDFQCPTCAKAHEKLEPLFRQNLAKMNYIRVDLPLFENHDWAVQAAMGGRAIQKAAPAKYWDYVDWVFKNQESIEKRKDFDAVLREYADDNDIAWASLQKTYTSATERQALLDQVSRAFTIGIASTPTFIVNGQIMGYGPEGTFTTDAIKSALGVK